MEGILDKLITVGVGLALLGGTWFIWFVSGVANNLFSETKWSWRRTFEDVVKTLLMGMTILAWVVIAEALDWYTQQVGMDISALLDGASITGLIAVICGGSGYYVMKAFRNFGAFIGTDHVANKVGEANYKEVATVAKNTIKEIAEALTPEHTVGDTQTDATANPTEEEIEVGQGSDISPLLRRLPDGNNDHGKGWQCSKYSWFLASGITMNYPPHPDYGPCNGNAMVDYLINKLGWVECEKQDGAIFGYSAGAYGHTGLVVDTATNLVNDANWKPLTVATHYLNLDAVGARYCCPKSMVATKTPSQTQPSTPSKPPKVTAPNKKGNTVEYTYQSGDTFGEVITKLGLKTSHGLWGADGDVAYYTKQLGVTGNIPIGTKLKFTRRES